MALLVGLLTPSHDPLTILTAFEDDMAWNAKVLGVIQIAIKTKNIVPQQSTE